MCSDDGNCMACRRVHNTAGTLVNKGSGCYGTDNIDKNKSCIWNSQCKGYERGKPLKEQKVHCDRNWWKGMKDVKPEVKDYFTKNTLGLCVDK